jgi:hypothetical protein
MQNIKYAHEKTLIGDGFPAVASDAGNYIKIKDKASVTTP